MNIIPVLNLAIIPFEIQLEILLFCEEIFNNFTHHIYEKLNLHKVKNKKYKNVFIKFEIMLLFLIQIIKIYNINKIILSNNLIKLISLCKLITLIFFQNYLPTNIPQNHQLKILLFCIEHISRNFTPDIYEKRIFSKY